MSKQPKAAAIDAAAMYKVALTRSVPVGRIHIHPGPNARLRGDALKAIIEQAPDAIAGYEAA